METLTSFIETYARGKTAVEVFVLMDLPPALLTSLDNRLQPIPRNVAERLASYLNRPLAEVARASGGSMLTAPAPGAGRLSYTVPEVEVGPG